MFIFKCLLFSKQTFFYIQMFAFPKGDMIGWRLRCQRFRCVWGTEWQGAAPSRAIGRGTVPRNCAGRVPRSFVRVSVNHQRLVCLENSRIEPTPEQVRPNFWNWKESGGGVQHRFLCHVVARNLPAEPRNLHAELLNFLSQNLAKKCLFQRKANI